MRKVLSDQSYYLVGYEPDPETFSAKNIGFNKFDVKVTRPGAKVRYRRGFYGVSEEQLDAYRGCGKGLYPSRADLTLCGERRRGPNEPADHGG